MDLILSLKKLYPDGIVTNLKEKDIYLFYKLILFTEEKEMRIEEFLISNDLKYLQQDNINPNSLDLNSIKLLITQYRIKQVLFAQWFGVSRQAINERLKRDNSTENWVVSELSNWENEVIIDMVENKLFTFVAEDVVFAIRNNFSKACVLIKIGSKVKTLFNLSENLARKIAENEMDILGEEDLLIRSNIEPVVVLGRKLAKLNSRSSTLRKIRNQCELRNMTIQHYLALHSYENMYNNNMISDENTISMIKNYVLKDNVVFFPHTVPDYYNVVNRASRNNMTLDQYFEFFGFIKVDNRLDSSYNNKIEEYKMEILNYVTDGKVYIPSDSSLYRKLYYFAKRREISIGAFLMELGFERVFVQSSSEASGESTNSDLPIDKYQILQELKHIQGELNRIKQKSEKVQRNRNLVKKLKHLYENKCQLCDEKNGIPVIEKEDGSYYVEVHHIKEISYVYSEKIDLDDTLVDYLDTYKNAIVICPFHHKILHYHKGGYRKLIRNKDSLYFSSEKGCTLKVNTNYHLEATN